MSKFTSIDDVLTIDGIKVTARVEHDGDMGPPWEEDDGHGPVSEWTRRAKHPGEMVLAEDRGHKRFYDFAEAVKIARRDGWDAPPYGGTPGQKAHRAAMADFENLRAWCNDEWHWCGVVLSVSIESDDGDDIELSGHAASLWGIESNGGDYLIEVANELVDEALDVAKAIVGRIKAVAI